MFKKVKVFINGEGFFFRLYVNQQKGGRESKRGYTMCH